MMRAALGPLPASASPRGRSVPVTLQRGISSVHAVFRGGVVCRDGQAGRQANVQAAAASTAVLASADTTAPQRPSPPSPGKTVTRLKLDAVCTYMPHPAKISYGGEDAHFISTVGGGSVGVADGVGGWQEEGVNPADYSRSLMKIAQEYLEQQLTDLTEEEKSKVPKDGRALLDPKGALNAAHMRTRLAGSSTACVMQLDQEGEQLLAANLGDSGFVVVRGQQIVARSKPMEHSFDCPLQFGACPEFVEITDTAEQAELYTIKVQPGDTIVAGSDGLWDNTYDQEIISAVSSYTDIAMATKNLAATAREHACDPKFESPYIREAVNQGYDLPWHEKLLGASFQNGQLILGKLSGGKLDDITVLMARVVQVTEEVPAEPAPVVEAEAAAEAS